MNYKLSPGCCKSHKMLVLKAAKHYNYNPGHHTLYLCDNLFSMFDGPPSLILGLSITVMIFQICGTESHQISNQYFGKFSFSFLTYKGTALTISRTLPYISYFQE